MKYIKKALVVFGVLILSATLIFAIASFPYFWHFREEAISTNPQDWSAFGSFVAGISSVLNVTVFIILTIYVAKLSDTNSQKEINSQKKIIISQFRQSEIKILNEQLDKALILDDLPKLNEIVNASFILTNFLNQKQYLFPILKTKDLQEKINRLNEKYKQMTIIIEKIQNTSKETNLDISEIKRIEAMIQSIITLKDEIIETCQEFILKELDK